MTRALLQEAAGILRAIDARELDHGSPLLRDLARRIEAAIEQRRAGGESEFLCCGGSDESPPEHTQDCAKRCDCGHTAEQHGYISDSVSSECDECSCVSYLPAPATEEPTTKQGEAVTGRSRVEVRVPPDRINVQWWKGHVTVQTEPFAILDGAYASYERVKPDLSKLPEWAGGKPNAPAGVPVERVVALRQELVAYVNGGHSIAEQSLARRILAHVEALLTAKPDAGGGG